MINEDDLHPNKLQAWKTQFALESDATCSRQNQGVKQNFHLAHNLFHKVATLYVSLPSLNPL